MSIWLTGTAALPVQDLLTAQEQFEEALEEGDLEAASCLVEEHGKGPLLNARLSDEALPLEAAIKRGDEDFVRWLMEEGAWLSDVGYSWAEAASSVPAHRLCRVQAESYKAQPGLAELVVACQHGHLGIVQCLIERGADPQGRDRGWRPLVAAARNGHLPVV